MKNFLKFNFLMLFVVISFVFISSNAKSQTEGTLTFNFTDAANYPGAALMSANGNGTPVGNYYRNFMVVWITNSTGQFVKTLTFNCRPDGGERDHFPVWNENSGQNLVDAISGATRTQPDGTALPIVWATNSITWNGTDFLGNNVPDGTYFVTVESAWDRNLPGHNDIATYQFTKGATTNQVTGTPSTNFSAISLNWQPNTISITPNQSSLAFGVVGSATKSSFTVAGTGTTAGITVSVPVGSGYTASETEFGTYSNTFTFSQASGGTVWVTFTPTAGQYSTSIVSLSYTGATTKKVSLTGAGTGAKIQTSATTLALGNYHTPSMTTILSYTVSGVELASDLIITPPVIASDVNAWLVGLSSSGPWVTSLTLPQTSGNIALTTIYVKFNPSVVSSPSTAHNGTITNVAGAVSVNVAVTGRARAASITNTPSSSTTSFITFGSANVGGQSDEIMYNVTGTYFLSTSPAITVTPPAGFEISFVSGGPYQTTPLTIPAPSVTGTIITQNVYAVFKPTALGIVPGATTIITHVSGTTTRSTYVTGTGIDVSATVPKITLAPATLTDFGNLELFSVSPVQTLNVTSIGFATDITVTCPLGFEISSSTATVPNVYGRVITLPSTGGIVNVRFVPTSKDNYTGNISFSSPNIVTKNVSVTGKGILPATIEMSKSTLDFTAVQIGNTAEQTYTIAGYNLLGNILIGAPSGYLVKSSAATTPDVYASSIQLAPATGVVSTAIVSVKFTPVAATTYPGTITNVSGTASKSVTVSGTGTAIPTFTVTLESSPAIGGSTSGNGTFEQNANISVSATPATHYTFVDWKNGVNQVSTANPYSFNVTENVTLTAYFLEDTKYTLTVVTGTGGTCNVSTGQHYTGSVVTLTATSDAGYIFDKWVVGTDEFTTNVIDVTMTSDKTATASFIELYDVTFNLNVANFDGTTNSLYIAGGNAVEALGGIGSYARWAEPGTDADFLMSEVDATHYTLTLSGVEAGNYEYKYFWVPAGSHSWNNANVGTNMTFAVTNADVVLSDSWTFVGVTELNKNVRIYPNPSKGLFTVSVDGQYTANVYDITGKIVTTTTLNVNNNTIDLTSQNAGMYFIQLVGQNTINFNVVVE